MISTKMGVVSQDKSYDEPFLSYIFFHFIDSFSVVLCVGNVTKILKLDSQNGILMDGAITEVIDNCCANFPTQKSF